MTDSAVFHDSVTGDYRDASGPLVIGAGLPDPTGEPDGQWLRTASGAAVWVAATASDIPFVPAGTISATDVQAAIEEVAAEASGAVSSVFGRTGAVLAVAGDYTAADVGADASGAAAAAQAASQPLDSDLTAIAGLDASTAGAISSDGAGWIKKTYAQFKTALSLVKGDVGLGNVDNTSDASKVVASAAILTTARTIDGQSFDGSGNITVIAPGTHAATGKTTPVDADELALVDSAASNVLKKLTWANVKATLKTYFDTLYIASGASAPPNGTAGGALDGTYPNPGLAAGVAGAGLAETADVLSVNVDTTTIAITTDTLGLVPAAIGGVAWTTLTKPGDTSRDTTTTVAADPDLTFTPASGGVYEIEAFIIYASPAGAGTPDLKIAFGEDATARGITNYIGWNTGDVAANTSGGASTGGFAQMGTAAANRVVQMRLNYVGTGAAAAIYWAQVTSSGNATILRAGSVLRYRRIV